MNTLTKSKVLHFSVYMLFLLSLIASGNTLINYRFTETVLSTADAFRPSLNQGIIDSIESNLGKGKNATDILNLLHSEQKVAAAQYQIWLNYVQSQKTVLRNQLIMCLSLLGLSLTALIAIYWKRNAP